jgi:hypothetical protein
MDLRILGKSSVLHVELKLSIEHGFVLICRVLVVFFSFPGSGCTVVRLLANPDPASKRVCWCPYCIRTSDTEVRHQVKTYSTYQLRTSLAFLT